jgi:hypothetical protein
VKTLNKFNSFIGLTKKEKQEKLDEIEKNYETNISEYGLNVIFVYLQILEKSKFKKSRIF